MSFNIQLQKTVILYAGSAGASVSEDGASVSDEVSSEDSEEDSEEDSLDDSSEEGAGVSDDSLLSLDSGDVSEELSGADVSSEEDSGGVISDVVSEGSEVGSVSSFFDVAFVISVGVVGIGVGSINSDSFVSPIVGSSSEIMSSGT